MVHSRAPVNSQDTAEGLALGPGTLMLDADLRRGDRDMSRRVGVHLPAGESPAPVLSWGRGYQAD